MWLSSFATREKQAVSCKLVFDSNGSVTGCLLFSDVGQGVYFAYR